MKKNIKLFLISVIVILSIVFIVCKVNEYQKLINNFNHKTGFYVVKHKFFLDKIYIDSNQVFKKELKIISIKKTKNKIIIQTNSKETDCYVGLCDAHKINRQRVSTYMNIPNNKKIVVLDDNGNEMKKYK